MGEVKQRKQHLCWLEASEVSAAYDTWCGIHGQGHSAAFATFIGASVQFRSQTALPRIAKRVKLMGTVQGYVLLKARAARRKKKV